MNENEPECEDVRAALLMQSLADHERRLAAYGMTFVSSASDAALLPNAASRLGMDLGKTSQAPKEMKNTLVISVHLACLSAYAATDVVRE